MFIIDPYWQWLFFPLYPIAILFSNPFTALIALVLFIFFARYFIVTLINCFLFFITMVSTIHLAYTAGFLAFLPAIILLFVSRIFNQLLYNKSSDKLKSLILFYKYSTILYAIVLAVLIILFLITQYINFYSLSGPLYIFITNHIAGSVVLFPLFTFTMIILEILISSRFNIITKFKNFLFISGEDKLKYQRSRK